MVSISLLVRFRSFPVGVLLKNLMDFPKILEMKFEKIFEEVVVKNSEIKTARETPMESSKTIRKIERIKHEGSELKMTQRPMR